MDLEDIRVGTKRPTPSEAAEILRTAYDEFYAGKDNRPEIVKAKNMLIAVSSVKNANAVATNIIKNHMKSR